MRRHQLACCILFLAGFIPSVLSGQWRGPRFETLGPAQGLPAHILSIAQDSSGFIYFGTNTGMYRYDGNVFEYFGHDPLDDETIGPGDVINIYPASDGLIWVTLSFGGLNAFDPVTGKFKRYPLPEMSFRMIPGAYALYEDKDGTLWVGAAHFRLLEFDRANGEYITHTPDWIDARHDGGRLTILSIVPDEMNSDLLWLSVLDFESPGAPAGSYGMVTYDRKKGAFATVGCFGTTRLVDDAGIMWGTYWGSSISTYDRQKDLCDRIEFEFDSFGRPVGGISLDVEEYQGDILVASSRALLKYNRNKTLEVFALAEPGGQQFLSLFEDRDHRLWVGTNQGALVLDPDDHHIRFFSLSAFGTAARLYPGRLAYASNTNTVLLAHTSDELSQRVYRIPLHPDESTTADFVPTSFNIHGVATDRHDRIWIAGDGDLHLMSAAGEIRRTSLMDAHHEPLPWLWNMKAHTNGWIGAVGLESFYWFHEDSQVVRSIVMKDLPGSEFAKSFDNHFDGFTFTQDSSVLLFSNEIIRIDLLTGEARAMKLDPSVNPHQMHIQFAGEGKQDDIWISSVQMIGRFRMVGDSLVLLDRFTVADGLISPLASELHVDAQGRVWTFTHSGMNCINPETREIRFFGTKEGLPNPYIDPRQIIELPNGEIATVCGNGLIVFNTSAVWESVSPTNEPVVIKQIRIGGDRILSRRMQDVDALALKPDQKLVDIEFQALAYPTDYRMEYSYRVAGLHEDWIPIGQNRFVTLPSLSPGNYTFEVKAGKPSSDAPVKSIAIHVGTPFYLRPWFLILSLLALFGIITALMQWRIRTIRKQEASRTEINKKIAELELKALRSQMNPHFMFNSLNSIKNYILQAEPRLAAEYLSNFAHLIRMILQNSREKSISLQEELETLMLYIDLEKLRFDEEFDFSCSVEEGLSLEHIRIPPMLLQPYVENAIWHGLMHKKEKGHLQLRFTRENGKVACIIDDDGVGRQASAQMKSLSAVRYKSMGMGITKDRIEIMNKMDALGIDAEVTDKQDADGRPAGTRVTVRIPGENGLLH